MVDDVYSMPKAELHAHLNGSLSNATLTKLISLKSNKDDKIVADEFQLTNEDGKIRNMEECFQMFSVIHKLTDTWDAIYLATVDVIKDFSRDHVRYLELRTTPRAIEGGNATKYLEVCEATQKIMSYVDAVIAGIDYCRKDGLPILVKLLLSIDRSKGIAVARTIVDIADKFHKLRPDLIVGLDVSGFMMNSNLTDYFPLLNAARKFLKLSVHTAEVRNDQETEAIILFKPDRIGHGTFIFPSAPDRENPRLLDLLKKYNIPVELCLTSNVICKSVSDYKNHHIEIVLKEKMPFAICTDDQGVFNTSLSKEYEKVGKTFNLSIEELWRISWDTLDHSFASLAEKEELRQMWLEEWQKSGLQNKLF